MPFKFFPAAISSGLGTMESLCSGLFSVEAVHDCSFVTKQNAGVSAPCLNYLGHVAASTAARAGHVQLRSIISVKGRLGAKKTHKGSSGISQK